MKSRVMRIVLWGIVGLFALIVAAGATLYFMSDDLIRKVAGEKGSAELGRKFSINGPVKIDWDWQNPYVHISGIELSNWQGSKDADMVSIDQLNFHIKIWRLLEAQLNLPDIEIVKPKIVLEKRDAENKNWDFPAMSKANVATAALPSKRSNFPILGDLKIEQGSITYRDASKNLDVKLDIDTATGGGGEQGAFTVSGKGSLQNQPFEIKAQAGSLGMLRETEQDYPLNLHLKMGATQILVDGTFKDPVKMEGIDATLKLSGDNLADLYYLTQIPLPPTPVYSLSGHLTKTGEQWNFADFKGKVGGSDLVGNLAYDTSHDRGYVKAELNSKLLDVKDLGGLVGIKQKSSDDSGTPKKDNDSGRMLPDMPLDLSRLRATDMDVTLKAEEIKAPDLPVNDLNVGFHLRNGDLKIDPFELKVASGDVSGQLDLDGSKDIPRVKTNIALNKLSLKQFFGKTQFAPQASGYIGGHFDLDGKGKSLAEVFSTSNGSVTAIMASGTISQLVIDAAGLDIAHAIGGLIGKDDKTGVRCMVGDFKVTDGILNSNTFVLDTQESNITGDAHINLKDETIKARITGEPKSTTVTAHAPITVSGRLKHPDIGVDAKETAGRGAVAAVLGVFLTPLAAVLPFIETGVGEDSDCASLIQQAKAHTAEAAAKEKLTPAKH